MSLVSAVVGRNFSTTLMLAQNARAIVSWQVRDPSGTIVLQGTAAPAGSAVVVAGVLPSTSVVPIDGSKYSISASDGNTSVREYFTVLPPSQVQTQHGLEVAYLQKRAFRDTLILRCQADCVSVTMSLADDTWPIPPATPVAVCDPPWRRGDAWVYQLDLAKSALFAGTAPPGVVNTKTSTGLGMGTVVWDYTPVDDVGPCQELHPFYTITTHSMFFMTAIGKLIDKARIGDVNAYLSYTPSDLCHGLIRGMDYVMQSPPVAGGWSLDQCPVALRDYIVKAGAIDMLRAQYQAEGMSQFDLQGMRTQLLVDRTQYLAQLIGELEADMAGLPQAKNEWLAQGAPLGSQLAGGVRPIGVLGLTRGTYSPWPMQPMPIISGGAYSFIGGGLGYGPLF